MKVLPALLPLVWLVVTGGYGIDFGFHWDEDHHLATIRTAVERGAPLPGEYRYPSVTFWLALAGAAPEVAKAVVGPPGGRARLEALGAKSVRLRTRLLFLVVSSSAVLFTYLATLTWRRRVPEALVAASILGLSWEVAYHARWIAPDGVLMALGAATLAATLRARREPHRGAWVAVAVVAAGLACGTKWPAGLLLLPVGIVAWESQPPGTPLRRRARRGIGLLGLFVATYLATTPGTLLEAGAFFDSLRIQQGVYARGHLGHTVAPGLAHLGRVVEYFALAVGSPYPGIAVAVFACATVGAGALVRASRRTAAVVLSFPAAYLAFFCLYPVMIPRNYLVLVPFFAVLAARGGAALLARVPWRPARFVLVGAAALALLANAAWLALAAASIREYRDRPPLRPVLAWVDAHPDTRFAVSPRVRRALVRTGLAERPNVVDAPPWEADRAIFLASEEYGRLLGARPGFGLTDTWFGPYEVDFDFYPSWLGSDRVVVMPSGHLPRRPLLRPEQMPADLRPGASQ